MDEKRKNELKNRFTACEICRRNFEKFQLRKCVKQVNFTNDNDENHLVICSDCNYVMFQTEQINTQQIINLIDETSNKLAEVLKEFQKKRDEIVSNNIIRVVDKKPVTKRAKMDMLYKYPHWEAFDKLPAPERDLYEKRYRDYMTLAKSLGAWDGNHVDVVSSQKVQTLRYPPKNNEKEQTL